MQTSICYLIASVLVALHLSMHTVAGRPIVFGSLFSGSNLAHLYPFMGAAAALGGPAVNDLLTADIASLAPGTSVFFGQPLVNPFVGMSAAITSYAQAQTANVLLQRMLQNLQGYMGSIFPLPTL